MVDIALTKPQRDFCFSKALHPAIVGGLGSGKSAAGTMRLILLLLGDKGADGAYYMPTYDLIKLRAMIGVESDLDRIGIGYTTNRSDYSIQLNDGYGKIIFRSYDRPERIIAYEVAHSICDELDTLGRDKAEFVWRKITERNRQKRDNPNTIGLVTTPDQGTNGFVYHKWVKQAQDGYELIKASTYSNPYLPKGYIDNIKKNYSDELAALYLMGEFVSLNEIKILKPHYWRKWTADESLPICQWVFHSYDTAFSEKDSKTAAYSACTRWGIFWHPQRKRYCIMLLGRWADKVGYPELRQKLIDLDKKFKPDLNLIEAKATGLSLIQDLKDAVQGTIKSYSPGKGEDKISRAHSITPIFEMGLVYTPIRDWVDEFIGIVSAFPHGKPPCADYTDTVTQALIYLRKSRWFENTADENLQQDEIIDDD
jgi:predicted phage terminase large subunit-like protein